VRGAKPGGAASYYLRVDLGGCLQRAIALSVGAAVFSREIVLWLGRTRYAVEI